MVKINIPNVRKTYFQIQLLLPSGAASGKLLYLSEPQVPHLENGNNRNAHLIRLP